MIRLTSKRKQVFDVISNSNKPIDAEGILSVLGESNINLSTIYRSIEFFNTNNLLLTFHFNNKSYYFLNDEHNHHHYFICTKCLKMEKVKCNMHDIISTLEHEEDYLITNHEMTIYGLCKKCHS